MESVENYMIGGAALLAFSVLASKATGRLGVPALIAFLAIGMLAGSEGIGGFAFDSAFMAQSLGVLALVFILFSGGLDTSWPQVRPIVKHGVILATLGVVLTCLATGWFATVFLGFEWLEGMLLGAIISSTDAAAVFAVLRSRSVGLKGQLKPLLELESGSNDPMAVLLVVGILQLMSQDDASLWKMIPHFVQQMAFGAACGFVAGKLITFILNRVTLEFEGLYPVLTIALIILVYGLTQAVGGNGFLAVYLAGIVLGNQNFIHKKSLMLFHDGLSWIFQIVMFLTLGLLVTPSQLIPVIGPGLMLSAFLILVARPIAVYLSLIRTRFTQKEKTLIAWVGLRGAVPIVLATYPLMAGIPQAHSLFHLVFFIVLTSVVLQGTSIPFVARLLKVDTPTKQKFQYPIEYVPTGNLKSDLVEIEVPANSVAIGKSIIDLSLPKDALVVLIQRKGNVVVPKGGTTIEADDKMLVLAEQSVLEEIRKIIKPVTA